MFLRRGLVLLMGGGLALLAVVACGGEEAATPTPAGASVIRAVPTIRFDRSQLSVPANTSVTIVFQNEDTGVSHNFAVYRTSAAQEKLGDTRTCSAPCQERLTLRLAPGEYFFRCDVHPQDMTGTLVAR